MPVFFRIRAFVFSGNFVANATQVWRNSTIDLPQHWQIRHSAAFHLQVVMEDTQYHFASDRINMASK
jgi:hypothetical protein